MLQNLKISFLSMKRLNFYMVKTKRQFQLILSKKRFHKQNLSLLETKEQQPTKKKVKAVRNNVMSYLKSNLKIHSQKKLRSPKRMYAWLQLLEVKMRISQKMTDRNFWSSIFLRKTQHGHNNLKTLLCWDHRLTKII